MYINTRYVWLSEQYNYGEENIIGLISPICISGISGGSLAMMLFILRRALDETPE
jgi:hypothetical protein